MQTYSFDIPMGEGTLHLSAEADTERDALVECLHTLVLPYFVNGVEYEAWPGEYTLSTLWRDDSPPSGSVNRATFDCHPTGCPGGTAKLEIPVRKD